MARLLAAVNSVSYLLFSTIGIPNVERWGRRKMLMYAAAGQCFCYLIITVMIRYNEMPGYAHQTEVAKASVAFFFLYYVFFGIGFQGVPWLREHERRRYQMLTYHAEINSLSMKNKGAALGTATNWMCKFYDSTPLLVYTLTRNCRQLHCGGNYTNRHQLPRLEILHHLDRLQRSLRATRISLLSRDRRSHSRGYRQVLHGA
jgi:hypothetical protein